MLMTPIAKRIKERQRKVRFWTFERESKLVRMWYENQPVNAICREFRKSKSAIHAHAGRLSLPQRNKKSVMDEVEKAKALRRDPLEVEIEEIQEVDRRQSVYDLARLGKTIEQIVSLTGLKFDYVTATTNDLVKVKLLAPGEHGTFVDYDPQHGNRSKKASTEYKGTARQGNIRIIRDPIGMRNRHRWMM